MTIEAEAGLSSHRPGVERSKENLPLATRRSTALKIP